MHRSRLSTALIDVPSSLQDQEVAFWTSALGREAEYSDPDNPEYAEFEEPFFGLQFMIQAVGDPTARLHLDIETDNVDAEVRRLEALGAQRVRQVRSWWIMRDPAGLVFCVVPVQLPEAFERYATEWPDENSAR